MSEPIESTESEVYFIGAEIVPAIKIGYSCRIGVRRATLETTSPVPLRVLVTAPGSLRTENALHALFAEQRLHGEWFKPSPALTDLIAKLQAEESLQGRRDILIAVAGPDVEEDVIVPEQPELARILMRVPQDVADTLSEIAYSQDLSREQLIRSIFRDWLRKRAA